MCHEPFISGVKLDFFLLISLGNIFNMCDILHIFTRNSQEWRVLIFLYIKKKVSTFSQWCTHTVLSFQRDSQWKWLHLWNPITHVDPLLFHLHCILRHFYNNSSVAHAIDSNLNPILMLLSRWWIAEMNAPPFSWYLVHFQFDKCMRILRLK